MFYSPKLHNNSGVLNIIISYAKETDQSVQLNVLNVLIKYALDRNGKQTTYIVFMQLETTMR